MTFRAALLLVATLAGLAWFLKGDRRFTRLADTVARRRRYRRWMVKAVVAFTVPTLVGLALLGRVDALAIVPREFAPVRALLPVSAGASSVAFAGVVGGAGVGGLIVGIATALRKRGGVPKPTGDIGALLPRNRAEIGHAAALSVGAGVTEELCFRLFLPLLLTQVTGSAFVAFAVSAGLFGAMHRYQGWQGVVATTVVGLAMTFVYLLSGALWLAVLLHILIDLNGLVLRPILGGAWRRGSVLQPPAGAEDRRDHRQT